VCQVNTLLTLLNGYLKSVAEAGQQMDPKRMERVFLFCVTWALGGLLDFKVILGCSCVSVNARTRVCTHTHTPACNLTHRRGFMLEPGHGSQVQVTTCMTERVHQCTRTPSHMLCCALLQDRPLLDAEIRNIDSTFMPPREDETDTVYEYVVSETGESCGGHHWTYAGMCGHGAALGDDCHGAVGGGCHAAG